MNAIVAAHGIIAGGSLLLGCQPISRTRTYAGWAKLAFAGVALLGLGVSRTSIALELGWWSPAPGIRELAQRTLIFGAGVASELILALFASGEMLGRPSAAPSPSTT